MQPRQANPRSNAVEEELQGQIRICPTAAYQARLLCCIPSFRKYGNGDGSNLLSDDDSTPPMPGTVWTGGGVDFDSTP